MTKSGQKSQEKKHLIVGTAGLLKILMRIISSADQSRDLDLILPMLLSSAPHTTFLTTSSQPIKPQKSLKDGIRVNLGDITLISKNKRKNTVLREKQS